jgi:hypothetical protein
MKEKRPPAHKSLGRVIGNKVTGKDVGHESLPIREGVKGEEERQEEQYCRDFLADAERFHSHPSFQDIMRREEVIRMRRHKILTFPATMHGVCDSFSDPENLQDPSEVLHDYYRDKPFMIVKRSDGNWFPSPLPEDYVDMFAAEFEERLKKTAKEKPWLIAFSVKWQDVLQRSFIGGNWRENNAGGVELVYKNPGHDPRRSYSREYELRSLDPEEEKMFLESVVDMRILTNEKSSIRPPKNSNSLAFEGWKEVYRFKLTDGRNFNVFLKHTYGSIWWEGKLVVVTDNGPENLFEHKIQTL